MLDWLGAPTWHFARSILNATAGRFLQPMLRLDGYGLAWVSRMSINEVPCECKGHFDII